MLSFGVVDGFPNQLLQALSDDFAILGPVRGADGVGRLQNVATWQELAPELLPLIPLKKTLLPPRDLLWRFDGQAYEPVPTPQPLALVGIAPCDLYALDYLDRVFSVDSGYCERRRRLFLVGTTCTPGEACFCPPREVPPPFDLFLANGRVWAGSAAGTAQLANLSVGPGEAGIPLPTGVTAGTALSLPNDLETRFQASRHRPLWADMARRCLSCGACSAVCPTCYCFDVVDDASPGGAVERYRQWDNCFFASHALVAGGQNFRPGQADRLRFRFEHKLLGFGALRGVPSCVGCGRCARACPVGIDIAAVLETLGPGGEP